MNDFTPISTVGLKFTNHIKTQTKCYLSLWVVFPAEILLSMEEGQFREIILNILLRIQKSRAWITLCKWLQNVYFIHPRLFVFIIIYSPATLQHARFPIREIYNFLTTIINGASFMHHKLLQVDIPGESNRQYVFPTLCIVVTMYYYYAEKHYWQLRTMWATNIVLAWELN